MFIGHLALGFAAKRAAPRVSLAMLFVAAQVATILTLWSWWVDRHRDASRSFVP